MNKKSWKLRLKRQFAGFLSICVIATSSLLADMSAWAAPSVTELENEDLDRMGSCESASYYFKEPSSDGDPGQEGTGHVIDIVGHTREERGYSTDGTGIFRITYNCHGFGTYINTIPSGDGAARVSIATNGGVSTMYDGDLEVKMKASPSADDRYVLIDYWLYNATPESKTYYLGSGGWVDSQDW